MSVVDPGKGVIDLVRSSNNRIIIAAPYIKSHSLRSLIAHIPDNIAEFVCITRWLPEDIASGVCDIEIFEDVTNLLSIGWFIILKSAIKAGKILKPETQNIDQWAHKSTPFDGSEYPTQSNLTPKAWEAIP